jgi:adenylate kinase
MNRFRTCLLVGSPGSGKGTQGSTLGKLPGFFHCACGDVFRSIDLRTRVGQAFLEYSSKGQLVPDEITVDLWMANVRATVENHQFKPGIDCLVLDGIPRNLQQARLMDEFLAVEKVFHLSCRDREKLVARMQKRALKDNRIDDANEDVIRNRLDVHAAMEDELLRHYPAEVIHHIDACEPAHHVLHQILSIMVACEPEFAASPQ